jgi:serine/threonine protein kinase
VSELCPFGTLSDVILQNSLGLGEQLEISLQIARVVFFVHNSYHVWHRDLKSENILVAAQWLVKLSDFR